MIIPNQASIIAITPKKKIITIVFIPDNPKLIPTGKLSILTIKASDNSFIPIGLPNIYDFVCNAEKTIYEQINTNKNPPAIEVIYSTFIDKYFPTIIPIKGRIT